MVNGDGLGLQVSGFDFKVSGFGFRVSGFGFQVLSFGLRVSGFGFRVSGCGFRVSGLPSNSAAARVRAPPEIGAIWGEDVPPHAKPPFLEPCLGKCLGKLRFDKLSNTTAAQGNLAHKKQPPPRTLQ